MPCSLGIDPEVYETLKLALLAVEAAMEKCPENNDTNFIGYALTADKLRFVIAKCEALRGGKQ